MHPRRSARDENASVLGRDLRVPPVDRIDQ